MAWTLCSKEEVQDLHSVAALELKDVYSEWVEQLIRNHLHEPNLGKSEVVTGEILSGDGTSILRVRKPKIISVESLIINGGTLSTSDYVVFPTYIELRNMVFPAGSLNVTIDYTSGGDFDSSVTLCATTMIAAIVNYAKRNGADMSIKWSNAEQRGAGTTPNMSIGLADHLNGIMKSFLQRSRVRLG